MKLYAVVAAYDDAPDEPQLVAAWPARWIDDADQADDVDENGSPQSCLDMVRGDPATVAAVIVAVDVPDEQLLALLAPAVPTVAGSASVVD